MRKLVILFVVVALLLFGCGPDPRDFYNDELYPLIIEFQAWENQASLTPRYQLSPIISNMISVNLKIGALTGKKETPKCAEDGLRALLQGNDIVIAAAQAWVGVDLTATEKESLSRDAGIYLDWNTGITQQTAGIVKIIVDCGLGEIPPQITKVPTKTPVPIKTPVPTKTPAPTSTPNVEATIEDIVGGLSEVVSELDDVDSVTSIRRGNESLEIEVQTRWVNKYDQSVVSFKIIELLAEVFGNAPEDKALNFVTGYPEHFSILLTTCSIKGEYKYTSLTYYDTLVKLKNKSLTFNGWVNEVGAKYVQ